MVIIIEISHVITCNTYQRVLCLCRQATVWLGAWIFFSIICFYITANVNYIVLYLLLM